MRDVFRLQRDQRTSALQSVVAVLLRLKEAAP